MAKQNIKSKMIAKRKNEETKRIADYGQRVLEALREGQSKLESVSHYEITDELGEGGMGTVFLAEHVSEHDIRKPVAIKVLKDTYNAESMQSFVEEARLLARLTQGTIVELLALESKELKLPGKKNPRTGAITPPKKAKLYFMVQEFVNGPGLDHVLKDLGVNKFLMHPALVGFILNKAVLALSEAHTLTDDFGNNLNLVHRDISPSNILFMKKAGITKLADFGVAKAFAKSEDDEGQKKLVGKPRYMAPEQLDGNALQVSDIWALGAIGYEALVGYAPYKIIGSNTRERILNLKKQFKFKLRSPLEILAPSDNHFELEKLSAIIMRCLSLEPEKRPDSLELNSMLEGEYLYSKGLGPTNKTLAAYIELLDFAVGEAEIIPPANYAESTESKTICATLKVDNPTDAFRLRTTKSYRKEFLLSVKSKHANPCLAPDGDKVFIPSEG